MVPAVLAPTIGFEPTTYRLGGDRYYPTELRGHMNDMKDIEDIWSSPLPWTLRRRPLYPAELRGRLPCYCNHEGEKSQVLFSPFGLRVLPFWAAGSLLLGCG